MAEENIFDKKQQALHVNGLEWELTLTKAIHVSKSHPEAVIMEVVNSL